MPYHVVSIELRTSIESFTTTMIELMSEEFIYNSIDLACVFKYVNSCLKTTVTRLIISDYLMPAARLRLSVKSLTGAVVVTSTPAAVLS